MTYNKIESNIQVMPRGSPQTHSPIHYNHLHVMNSHLVSVFWYLLLMRCEILLYTVNLQSWHQSFSLIRYQIIYTENKHYSLYMEFKIILIFLLWLAHSATHPQVWF